MSPTVLRSGLYRFHFYSQDGGEPAHVHVDRDDCSAEYNLGYSAIELRIIQRIIEENRVMLIRKWNEYFRA